MNKTFFKIMLLTLFTLPVLATITYTPPDPLPGQTVTFTFVGPNSVIGYAWDFGDGETGQSTQKGIGHVYKQTGTFTVKVNYKPLDSFLLTDTQIITITERRSIVAIPPTATPGQNVTFTARNFFSSNLRWDFGDSQILQGGPIVNHSYTAPGVYQLKVKEQGGDNIITITSQYVVSENRSITFQPQTPATGEPVQFQAHNFTSSCIAWDFGDGTLVPNGQKTMTHIFARAGTFRVSARDNCGASQPITISIQVQAARSITLLTSHPVVGATIQFMTQNFVGKCIQWNFGDSTAPVSGTAQQTHVFPNPGSFHVVAKDFCGDTKNPREEAFLNIMVEAGIGPQAPFAISYINLRFADGKTTKQVVRDSSDLEAFADLKFEGSGSLMLQWLVDGQAFTSQNHALNFADQTTISSGKIPPLPTQNLGRHTVTLRVIAPRQSPTVPSIEYTVVMSLSSNAPRVNQVFPGIIAPEQEVLLKYQGVNFDAATQFSPGSGIAPIGQAVIKSDSEAEQKVFVSRGVPDGYRLVKASNRQGVSTGPGKIMVQSKKIIPLWESIDVPCPTSDILEKIIIKNLKPDSYFQATRTDGGLFHLAPHILTNDSRLSWEIVGNPQAVEFFEVEFYSSMDKGSQKLLAKRRVPGGQNFFKSDLQLIAELQKAKSPNLDHPRPCDPDFPTLHSQNPESDYDKADVWWTVKGYQMLDCPLAQQQNSREAREQIDESNLDLSKKPPTDKKNILLREETWPKQILVTGFDPSDTGNRDYEALMLPNATTGTNCIGGGSNPGKSVNLANVEKQKTIKNGQEYIDPNDYPQEKWELTGQIDTSFSPLGTHGTISITPPKQSGSSGSSSSGQPYIDVPGASPELVNGVDFDNIFVDWGDGSVEPLSAIPACPIEKNGGMGSNILKGRFDLDKAYHKYNQAGKFTVKIYQLANVGVGINAAAANNLDPAWQTLALLGTFSQGGSSTATASSVNKIPLLAVSQLMNTYKNGYLFFCQELLITQPMDLCATGPLNLISADISSFSGQVKKKNQIRSLPPTASTCDEMFTATADITYFGKGSIEVTWLVDGYPIGGKQTYSGLSSPQRQNLAKNEQYDCSKAIYEKLSVESPPLPVQEIGQKQLSIVAKVLPDLNFAFIGSFFSQSMFESANPAAIVPWLSLYLNSFSNSSSSSTSLGLSGATLLFLQTYLKSHPAPPPDEPPLQVVASATYKVAEAAPGSICRIIFPTNKGDFIITNVAGRLTKTTQGYSGQGTIKLPFTSASDSSAFYGIDIPIQNWKLDETTGMVINGSINQSPGKDLAQIPAVSAQLTQLQGSVKNGKKEDLKATLGMLFKNLELRLPGDKDKGEEKPPSWNLAETLSSEGDWLAKAALPEILLSWSSFRISSPEITFDFNKKEHAPASGPCSGNGPSFVGVDLGNATIAPYTFAIIAEKPLFVTVNGWVVTDTGVCGHMESQAYSMKFKKGTIAFDRIIFDASSGDFKAQYKNLTIHVPWLEVDLKGDASLQKHSGEYGLDFAGVTSPAVSKNLGQITLLASDLRFTTEKNIGWVVRSKTHFQLNAENKKVSEFTIPKFFYGFDGYPYFSEGGQTTTLSLGHPTKLGDTPLTLKAATLTCHDKGPTALDIGLGCQVNLSENPIIPSADSQVDYAVKTGNPLYIGAGPYLHPFTLDVAFPLGSPSITAKMNPIYTPGQAADGASAGAGGGGASFSGSRFYGKVDMAMFGGPPIATQMLLGYQGGKSYFLVRGDIPLGPTGIPMSPLPFSIFRLSGGLGYNFPVNSFYNMSIENAQPDMSGETLFMAGLRIGSSDMFTFTMDGITTVKTSGEASLKFDAWLLTQDHSGNGQLQGILQYASGGFDGKIWGKFGILNDMAGFTLGTGPDNAALDIHLGNSDWHFYAGKREGPRIAATILGKSSGEAYLMLGNQVGLVVGGRQSWDLTGVNFAYIRGYMEIGLQITPEPKIRGDFMAGLSAGVCVPWADDLCVSASADAHVTVMALPLSMDASASIDLPWPFGSVSFSVSL